MIWYDDHEFVSVQVEDRDFMLDILTYCGGRKDFGCVVYRRPVKRENMKAQPSWWIAAV